MGLFDRTNGDKKTESDRNIVNTERVSIFDTNYPIDKSDWFEVFSACIAASNTIQNACFE